MKYKIEVTIPKHQQDERTDESVKHYVRGEFAKYLDPLLKLQPRDEYAFDHHPDSYQMGPPSTIYEGSLYAYETARMEDIIAKLETTVHFTVNPQTRNIIQEVIEELQGNKPIAGEQVIPEKLCSLCGKREMVVVGTICDVDGCVRNKKK